MVICRQIFLFADIHYLFNLSCDMCKSQCTACWIWSTFDIAWHLPTFVAATLLSTKDTAEYEQWRDERLNLGADPDGVNAQSLDLWHLNCTEIEEIKWCLKFSGWTNWTDSPDLGLNNFYQKVNPVNPNEIHHGSSVQPDSYLVIVSEGRMLRCQGTNIYIHINIYIYMILQNYIQGWKGRSGLQSRWLPYAAMCPMVDQRDSCCI